jgi:hypothetical protein
MIDEIYEKAIDEPSFGELYANLCTRLSRIASDNKFVHIIDSGEKVASKKMYRWSNNISTSDADIVGPFLSEVECISAALGKNKCVTVPRDDMELELVRAIIIRRIFIKIMKKQVIEEGAENVFYTVHFPVSEAEAYGQQMSMLYSSESDCKSNAEKKNSFTRSLINKCDNKFNEIHIYGAWQKDINALKSQACDQGIVMEEVEWNTCRIKFRKEMLGNVKFIGQLYKVKLLKDKLIRFCIDTMLMNLEERQAYQ